MIRLRETSAGGSAGGHDPRAHGKIRFIIRAFGQWANGKQHICAEKLRTRHPELCKGDCNALCAWIKDQWSGTTKWRGRQSDPKQKAEEESIRARAHATAYARFSAGMPGEVLVDFDDRLLKEWDADPPVLTESGVELLYAAMRKDGPTMDEVVRQALCELAVTKGQHAADMRLTALQEMDLRSDEMALALLLQIEQDTGTPPTVYSLTEGRYSAAERKQHATVRGSSYPIGDKAHARAALARINQAKPALSPQERAKVIAKARAKLRGR